MIRLLLVDDQPLVRAGLVRIFEGEPGLEVAGECADGDEVPAALARVRADVVLMDVRMRRTDGAEATRRLREVPGAPNSETRIEVIERGAPWWRYRLTPVTGRKHQLRVHMAALGAPIAYDPLYPQLADPAPDDPQRPLQLLAHALAFVDPLSGEPRRFDSGQALR